MAKRSQVREAAGKARAALVATTRANAGLINDIVDATVDMWVEGADFDSCLVAAQNQIADVALQRHGEKVRAGLARAGLELPPDTLSAAVVAEAISAKSGIDFTDFSPGGILEAVDRMLANRLSEVTGIEITSVIGNDLQTSIRVGVRAALRAGHGKRILGVVMERRAREAVTLKRLNSNKVELRRLKNRAAQARYREKNKLVWT